MNEKYNFYIDKKFIAYIIITLIVTTSVIIIIGRYFYDEKIGNIGSLLQGSIGIAVSLAGSIVAIRIANLGTEIVKREVKRDDFVKFNEVLQQTINPFKDLVDTISYLFLKAKTLNSNVRQLIDETLNNKEYEKLGEMEKLVNLNLPFDNHFKNEIAESIDALATSLENITKSPFSFYLWKFIANRRSDQFKNIETLSLTDFPYDKIEFDRELFDLIQILRVRASLMRQTEIIKKDIVFAHFHAISQILFYNDYLKSVAINLDKSQKGEIENDKKYQRILSTAESFIVLGFLVWKEPNFHKDLVIPNEFQVYSNIGAALIHDILFCIPTEEDIMEFNKTFFKEIFNVEPDSIAITKLIQELGTAFWYGGVLEEILGIVKSNFTFNKNWSVKLLLLDFNLALSAIAQSKERVIVDENIDEIVNKKKKELNKE